jgi:hypothetical protein
MYHRGTCELSRLNTEARSSKMARAYPKTSEDKQSKTSYTDDVEFDFQELQFRTRFPLTSSSDWTICAPARTLESVEMANDIGHGTLEYDHNDGKQEDP